MKWSFTLAFVVLSVYFVDAYNQIQDDIVVDNVHGYLLRWRCPKHFAKEECVDYVRSESRRMNVCNSYEPEGELSWLIKFCPKITCPPNLIRQEQDLSQPYPLCCEQCLPEYKI